MSIVDEEGIQNINILCQKSSKHQELVMTDHEMCGKVQAQADSPKSLSSDLTPEQKPF